MLKNPIFEYIKLNQVQNFRIAILLTSNEEGESSDGFIDVLDVIIVVNLVLN